MVLHNVAMSNYTGTAAFPDNCGELCQRPSTTDITTTAATTATSQKAATVVPVATVDGTMEALGLERLFMLKSDTEGFDGLVLRGARKALAGHNIDVVLFEYHGIGLWGSGQFTLKGVAAELESLGYICYFEGKLLTRITGCWSDALEVKTWSNIVCVASSKPLQEVLRAYSLAPFKGRY